MIAESVRHTYSVSRVYGAYNEALRKNERPQTCGSCLKRRVRELKAWMAEYERENPEIPREGQDAEGEDSARETQDASPKRRPTNAKKRAKRKEGA